MHLDPPGFEPWGHSYCCDFLKYWDKAIILPDFLLMNAIQDIETRNFEAQQFPHKPLDNNKTVLLYL